MNEEGEYVKKTQCPYCKYKDISPLCMWQTKSKCERFEKDTKEDEK